MTNGFCENCTKEDSIPINKMCEACFRLYLLIGIGKIMTKVELIESKLLHHKSE